MASLQRATNGRPYGSAGQVDAHLIRPCGDVSFTCRARARINGARPAVPQSMLYSPLGQDIGRSDLWRPMSVSMRGSNWG